MLSYHADMTLANNPFELNMNRLVDLDMNADFVSKAALKKIQEEGVAQRLVGLEIDGEPLIGSNDYFWPVMNGAAQVGIVTSAIYSPRLKKNIAMAMVRSESAGNGNLLSIDISTGSRNCRVVPIPFYDPKKSLATGSS